MKLAVDQLLAQNWDRLFGYAVSLAGEHEAAKDLLQECAVRALTARDVPKIPQAGRAWLFRIVRNLWLDGLRTAHRHQKATRGLQALPENSWSADTELVAGITIREAMARLDPSHREVVVLIDIVGFRYAEAADLIGVPVGTVMSRLSRARSTLLDTIDGQEVGAGKIVQLADRRRQ